MTPSALFQILGPRKKGKKIIFRHCCRLYRSEKYEGKIERKKKGRDFTISALFRILQTRGRQNFIILLLLFHPLYSKNQRQNKKSNKISLNYIISDLHTLKKQNKIYVISVLRLSPNCIWFSVSLPSPKFPSLRCHFSAN